MLFVLCMYMYARANQECGIYDGFFALLTLKQIPNEPYITQCVKNSQLVLMRSTVITLDKFMYYCMYRNRTGKTKIHFINQLI